MNSQNICDSKRKGKKNYMKENKIYSSALQLPFRKQRKYGCRFVIKVISFL